MLGSGEDEGVVDARWVRARRDKGHVQERVYGDAAGDIDVEVDATVVVEQEVAEDVCALDGLRITLVVREDAWVVGADEGGGIVICPKHVFPVWMR